MTGIGREPLHDLASRKVYVVGIVSHHSCMMDSQSQKAVAWVDFWTWRFYGLL
jgi:hypothetical protein